MTWLSEISSIQVCTTVLVATKMIALWPVYLKTVLCSCHLQFNKWRSSSSHFFTIPESTNLRILPRNFLYFLFLQGSVPNFCCNDELSSTMSSVGCLLTDSVLPDSWKLRAGNALERVQRVHEPADLWDITFCTRWFWGF